MHEMIKRSVNEDVRGFYLLGFDETGMLYDEAGYGRDVLATAKIGSRHRYFGLFVLTLLRRRRLIDRFDVCASPRSHA
jgi:hypothetical protein